MSATSVNSAAPKPRVARAGVPILGLLPVQFRVPQVHQDQVHIGAAVDHGEPGRRDVVLQEPGREDPGAFERALLTFLELR